MPNIAYRDIEDPELADLVATIRARRSTGKLLNLDRMLLHSPPFARGWNAMFAAIRNQMQVPRHINELAICAVARLNNADYEWIQHAPEFLAANGTQAQLDALDDVTSACYDTTAARTVDAKGRSVSPASTPTRWLDQMRVLPQQSGWIVDGGTTTPNAC